MQSMFLVGFMASGKSEVSRALSKRFNMPSVDLDRLIEDQADMTIAQIFAREGEAGFRQREAAALDGVCRGPASVVATGGGSPCFADNLGKMRRSGLVVNLATELSTALARASAQEQTQGHKNKRPLLAQPAAQIEELYRQRAPIYRRAHITVSTEGKSSAMVAEEIEIALACQKDLPERYLDRASIVAMRERSYPVVVERDCLSDLGQAICSRLPGLTRVGLISDTRVFALYGAIVARSLASQGVEVVTVQISPGEASKSISVYDDVCGQMIAGGLDRRSAIVALGGGVVGDLAGFVAASLFRGISLVQVPTTLLAMTDSAIGGKTGINSEHGKNLIGAFWQPSFVWSDPSTLATLDRRELRAAFGELVKYALLDDAIWPLVESLAPTLTRPSLEVTDEVCTLVRLCADLKAAVVSQDEREKGLRATLNLGHTVGHAIEAAAGYGSILHGEAVALGLIAACRVSHRLGLCSGDLESRVSAILKSAGLAVDLVPWLTADVLAHMRVDKKRTGSRVRFIAVGRPGDVRLQEIELDELVGLLLNN